MPKCSSAPGKGERTRQTIKAEALKLFAQRGIDAVSVRDINVASGQKNIGAINYHFSSREALIVELITDVARLLDQTNSQKIDVLEAAGGPKSIRDVVSILVDIPILNSPGTGMNDYALRFFNSALINHRKLLFAATRGNDNGTRRCLTHIRTMAPPMPAQILQQRLMVVMNFMLSAASSREVAREDAKSWDKLWGHQSAHENLVDMVVGLICAPVSDNAMYCLEKIPD